MRFSEILHEMIVRAGTPQDHSTLVAFGPYIWLFTPSENDRKILRDINKVTGAKLTSMNDVYDLHDGRPDILIGTIHEGQLFIYGSEGHFAASSPLVRKVVQQLGLDGAQHSRMSYNADEWEDEISSYAMCGDIPEIVYHGTCTKYIKDILRTGLRPTNNANWENVGKFRHLVFLTADANRASFHANRQADKLQSSPVVIATRIPDRALVTIDYDVAANFYGTSNKTKSTGYHSTLRRIAKTDQWIAKQAKRIQKFNPKRDFTKVTGILAYRGRIPPTYFTEFFATLAEDGDEKFLKMSTNAAENGFSFSSRDEFLKALDMFEEHGFYDPYYEPEKDEDWNSSQDDDDDDDDE